MHHMKLLDDNTKKCIAACGECREECESVLFQHCFKKGGRHVEERHVRLMADCIEICLTAANFMLRGSDTHAAICGVCTEICEACADSCDDIGGAEMEDCAETCRRCAALCREMSDGMRGASPSFRDKGQSTTPPM